MRASRNRRRLSAAALAILSMFSCSYGDRDDEEEDEKVRRIVLVLPLGDILRQPDNPVPHRNAVDVALALR